MNSKKLIRSLWKMFPLKIAKKYHDYVGLMVSHLKENTNKILLCLDVNENVINHAIEQNIDLIISHHPFIYGKKSIVLRDNYKKKMFDLLEKYNIPVYSFHTNFDECKNGMNDALASALKLNNIREIPNCPMGRMGELIEPLNIDDFASYALDCLNLKHVQLLTGEKLNIITVGIIGGSGSREAFNALENGCDIFLSGDTPYHIRRQLIDLKLNYLHVDHEVEKIFMSQMKNILNNIDSNLDIIIFDDVMQLEVITK